MPGYELERFVNLSQKDKDELMCSICFGIFCSPLVAQCCLQLFCKDCITDWLKNNNVCPNDNNICPYDRKPMTLSLLARPSRVMLNMIGNLKINCDFRENGCKEVVLLENLSQHTNICRYEKCKKCLSQIQDKPNHDCIKTLLELNRKSNEEKETLHKENRELKSEKESFRKTIEILERKDSVEALFEQARRHRLTPEVIRTDMNEYTENRVLCIVREEILKEYTTDFCLNIKDELDTEFGGNWLCIVNSHQLNVKISLVYEPGYMIYFKLAELYFKILMSD